MQTLTSTIFKSVALICFLSTLSGMAVAGAMFIDPLESKTQILKKHSEPMGTAVGGAGNVTPITKDPNSSKKIYCWQNGELIIEQAVIAPTDLSTDTRTLQSSSRGPEIQALDFRNAFCIIK